MRGGIFISVSVQLYSSTACFVWKPEHFEIPGYGGAGHKATIEFVEKYILIS